MRKIALAIMLTLALAASAWAGVPMSLWPEASTPLTGDEWVPLVQGGVSKKVAASDLGAGHTHTFSQISDATPTVDKINMMAGFAGVNQGVAYYYGGTLTTGDAFKWDPVAGVLYAPILRFADGSTMTTAAATSTGMSSTTDLNFAADSDGNGSGIIGFAVGGETRWTMTTDGLGWGTTAPPHPVYINSEFDALMGFEVLSGMVAEMGLLEGGVFMIDLQPSFPGEAHGFAVQSDGASLFEVAGLDDPEDSSTWVYGKLGVGESLAGSGRLSVWGKTDAVAASFRRNGTPGTISDWMHDGTTIATLASAGGTNAVWNSPAGTMTLQTGGVSALTIDGSQNARFYGDVNIGGTSTVPLYVESDAASAVAVNRKTTSGPIMAWQQAGTTVLWVDSHSGTNVELNAPAGNMKFQIAGDNALVIDTGLYAYLYGTGGEYASFFTDVDGYLHIEADEGTASLSVIYLENDENTQYTILRGDGGSSGNAAIFRLSDIDLDTASSTYNFWQFSKKGWEHSSDPDSLILAADTGAGTITWLKCDATNGKFTFYKDINLDGGEVLQYNGVQVVGAPQTGYTAMSHLTAVSNWDADTVTLGGLADIVGMMLQDLMDHGLLSN